MESRGYWYLAAGMMANGRGIVVGEKKKAWE